MVKIPVFGFGYTLRRLFSAPTSLIPVHGSTTTVTDTAEAAQPAADVPVIVYTVVDVGNTTGDPPE